MTVSRRRSTATVFLAVASSVSLTVLLFGTALPALLPAPEVAWRVGDDLRTVEQFAEIATGTPLRLEVELPFPAHVYVASWSRLQGTIALFPSQRLDTELANPLPAGRHALPGPVRGNRDGRAPTWPVHDVVGPITYFVVASREPLPDLEAALAAVRQMGQMGRPGTGFADDSLYLFAPAGGMKGMPANDQPAADVLRSLVARSLDDMHTDGRMRPVRPGSDAWGRAFVVQGR